MHVEEAIKLRLVMTILFREMGTRAAAFSAKIKSLRELQAKVGKEKMVDELKEAIAATDFSLRAALGQQFSAVLKKKQRLKRRQNMPSLLARLGPVSSSKTSA